ncbi:MFS general substrate transporter [Agrocybe pediades]|nr:MFS general substrate transporter [Agrocybe pediades]
MATALNAKPSQASFAFLDTVPPSPGLPRSLGNKPSFSPSSVTLAHSVATKPSQATLKGETSPLPSAEEKQPEPESEKPEKLPLPVTSNDVGPPPDGGLQAWLTVLGCSLVSFSTFGIVNAYGAFSDFYRTTFLSSSSPTLISMIGSVGVFVLYSFAAITGPIFDAFGPRYMIPLSGLVAVFALLMLSISQPHHIYQQFLCQSVLFNAGAVFGYMPSMAIIPHWFKKNTAAALGIVLASASLGGIVFPIMLHRLIPTIGFGWTIRALALIVLFSYSVATLTIRARLPRRPLPPLSRLIDFRAFLDIRYAIFVLGAWFNILSVFNPFFQIGAYGVAAHGSNPLTPYLLAIMCATGIAGRVIPGYIADRVGRFNTIAASTTCSSILTLALWYTSTAETNIVIFAALYGFASGPFFSLLPACVAQISPVERVGARIGMLFATLATGALAGTPIGGVFIRDSTVPNFRHLILYTGVLGLIGSAFLILARFKCDSRLRAVV